MEHLKRLEALWLQLATKSQLSEFVSQKDVESFQRRTLGEGFAFLTVALPRLFKSLDAAFAASQLEPVIGFKTGKGIAYPLFLSKAWSIIFNEDGSLKPYDKAQAGAVLCIRQLSAVFYKLELEYTKEQEESVISAFKQSERDLDVLDLTRPVLRPTLERARKIMARLLSGVDPLDIRPRHGGGSSACRVVPWERYCSFRYIPRLNEVFPYDQYFFYNSTHLCDNLHELVESEEVEPRARVVFVPKDSRGPRLISCEPREFMFIQQGLMAKLYETVERYPAINGQVGFTDQSRNRELAKEGSREGTFATLDLKEASDRVSWDLVRTIFPDNWVQALGASRSLGTELPDGTYVPFKKFAPMGSACCFPVEALLFWSIALAAAKVDETYLKRLFHNRLSPKLDMRMSVFGDDVIVPTEVTQQVMDAYHQCGLLVNIDKSYWSGPFRESCGGDFFMGHNVAPVRVKALPLQRSDCDSIHNYSHVRHRICQSINLLMAKYDSGTDVMGLQELFCSWYGDTATTTRWRYVDDKLEVLTNGLFLISTVTTAPARTKRRWNPHLHRLEFKVPCLRSVDVYIDADRWGMVMRRELENLAERPSDLGTLAKRVRTYHGWVPV
jgi:hypothetical protein